MAGYDVRSARTPVELFGVLSKQLVALVLIDLGNAAAGRREFWVALDAQRRGRALQVMTFRYTTPMHLLDPDFEPAARALADVEVQGAHEFPKIIDGVRQRIPLNGALPGMALPAPGAGGGIPPIGAALGLPSPFGQPAATPSQFGGPAYMGQPIPSNPAAGQPAMPDAAALLGQAPPYSQPYLQQFMPQQGMPQAMPPQAQAAPMEASPFASPIAGNPFSAAEDNSPFAQPYAVNPFADAAGQPGQNGAGMAQTPPFGAAEAPFAAAYGAPPPTQPAPFGQPARIFGSQVVDPASNWGQNGSSNGMRQAPLHVGAPVEDAWVPPEGDGALETGIVPSMAYQPFNEPNGFAAAPSAPAAQPQAAPFGQAAPARDYTAYQPTAPVPAATQLPAIRPTSATEQALGTVLVEGALLTEQKLEALKGIQQMLAGVNMQFKLGELALLFKFLSPDQLLAALLVSRGLVSPQQIAALGRVKQELGTSGMDHDLGTLLLMFHILPPEQLQALRAELNQ